MKKTYLILVISLICVVLASCGGSNGIDIGEYTNISWDDYVTLPDYHSYEISTIDIEITDETIDQEIEDRLAEAETESSMIIEGIDEEGDRINISFEGTLEDGSTIAGLSGDDYNILLGSGGFIDGFQEGLYGKNIGETAELDLVFPDPYEPNTDLSGKPVHFSVTINYKLGSKTLDEEFIKEDTEGKCSTEGEYREYLREYLEKMEYDTEVFDTKNELYYRIVDESVIKDIPENIYSSEREELETKFTNYALSLGMDWETFVEQNFGTAEDYEKEIDEYTVEQATQNMIIYALCSKEGIVVTEKEYQDEIQKLLDGYGVDEEGFQETYGISIENYAEAYNVSLNLHLEKFLDKLYEELAKE